ncbi:MAG: cellulase family glycosylhydrolase [Agathobacter sp.]
MLLKKLGKKALCALLCTTMVLGMAACGNGNPEESSEVPSSVNSENPSGTQQESETQVEEGGLKEVVLDVTPSDDPGNPLPFRVLNVNEMVAEMGTGWNLGNTMDGHSGMTPNEILWQNDKTTQKLIDAVHDMGFNTVRIPVTWGKMINSDYSIKDKWLSRVQDIVDYAIAQDMYVIINIHHDGADQAGWLNIATNDMDKLYEKFAGVWNTIATRFKDYDEHLIFESMNEVYSGLEKADVEAYGFSTVEAYDNYVIMQLNQIFVNTVRSTGSNNELRWLSVPGRYTNIEIMTNEKYGFKMPADTVENRMFAAVHYYDWEFGMAETVRVVEFNSNLVNNFVTEINKVISKFTSQGIPVIMGEYGAINKNNPEQRAYHNEIMNVVMREAGVVPVYWDQGWYDRTQSPADYSFSLVDRKTYTSIEKEVTDGLMRGYFVSTEKTTSDVVVSPTIKKISKVTLGDEKVTLTIGDAYTISATVEPADTNDVLLWKTADPSIVTVYNGKIRARGIGTTTITAFSQSGSVEATLEVTVNPVTGNGATDIILKQGMITLEKGAYQFVDVELKAAEGIYLTYTSSNPEVATVSKIGKITAIASGTSVISIVSSDGVKKTMLVTVKEASSKSGLTLGLYVLYADEALNYWGTESGDSITITEAGQYTLSFDFGTQASADALAAGITAIENLTAIYIKDKDVMDGVIEKSNLNAAFIKWDKIVVDGVELTITNGDLKNALKSSGIFDTNDPINSWDGSAVEEVVWDKTKHVVSINMEKPQKISITFTIQGLEFAE